jgi:hypothetical protein
MTICIKIHENEARSVAQLIECLPNQDEVLCPNPLPPKKKKKKRES